VKLIGDLTLVTAPTIEPLETDNDLKKHLRIDHNEEDDLIDGQITAARAYFEDVTHRALLTQTWRYTLDAWPDGPVIALPRPPLQSVTDIKYLDEDGNETTWGSSNYVVDTAGGRVALASNVGWPAVSLYPIGAIRITFVAGWTSVDAVPAQMKQCIKLLVGHWYEHREGVSEGAIQREIPFAVKSLVHLNRAY